MSNPEAEKLVRDLILATVESVKETNFRRGGPSKKTLREELRAVRAAFKGFTGVDPSDVELERMRA